MERLMILTCLTSGTLRHKLAISLNSNGLLDSECQPSRFGNKPPLIRRRRQSGDSHCGLIPARRVGYFLNVYDSWGDGGNGAYANVYIDGDFVGEAELLESDGDFAYYDVTLYPGEVFELEVGKH